MVVNIHKYAITFWHRPVFEPGTSWSKVQHSTTKPFPPPTGRQQESSQVDGVTAESLNQHYATISTDSNYRAPFRKQPAAQLYPPNTNGGCSLYVLKQDVSTNNALYLPLIIISANTHSSISISSCMHGRPQDFFQGWAKIWGVPFLSLIHI